MEQRTSFFLPAILACSSLLVAVHGQAAPADASGKPPSAAPPLAPPKPAAPPAPQASSTPAPAPPVANNPSPSSAPPSGAPGKPSAKLPGPKTPIEGALQQVVRLERAGRPIAVGTLLSGDGRILTALSPLTHGNQIDARYPEGQVVRVRLTQSDRAWDLALLTPEGDARRAGLKASREPAPALGVKLHALGYVREKQLGAFDATVKTRGALRGSDSAELSPALELSFTPKPVDYGAPVVNDEGEVVAIVARACASTDKVGCTLAPYAAPVSAIRRFLRGVPARQSTGTGIGIEVVAFDAGAARGVRIAGLAPDGPAADAGLRAGPPGTGDVIVAVNGAPVSSSEAFADAVEHAAGGPLRLMVLASGRYREVELAGVGGSGAPTPGAPGAPPSSGDRVYQSAPKEPWPRAPRPSNAPNPYR